ncbi:hypothetical protein EVAR_92959_1 [Eumeta japonica]|uniref:Uncharacterized protein n=1 Tax=Eumeta variegata TaxID=151549 RepID=A0A4C1TBF0_EUMVA|nr:hypothetical protein EVAR_92959_1 [Eumeta japonica]
MDHWNNTAISRSAAVVKLPFCEGTSNLLANTDVSSEALQNQKKNSDYDSGSECVFENEHYVGKGRGKRGNEGGETRAPGDGGAESGRSKLNASEHTRDGPGPAAAARPRAALNSNINRNK